MIQVAIVEDEEEHVQILRTYLDRYQKENSVNLQICEYKDGLDIISEYCTCHDIVLLDIQMKYVDGMKAAEHIRKLDQEVALIFITSDTRFAIQGYMVSALGYVLKPVSYLAFSQVFGKAVKKALKNQDNFYLIADSDQGQVRLDSNQIYYIESQRHHIKIHSEQGDYIMPGPLKRVEAQLSGRGFSKCHNAYLVNLFQVTAILPTGITLTDKSQLPVSRAKRAAFLDNLAKFVGGLHV